MNDAQHRLLTVTTEQWQDNRAKAATATGACPVHSGQVAASSDCHVCSVNSNRTGRPVSSGARWRDPLRSREAPGHPRPMRRDRIRAICYRSPEVSPPPFTTPWMMKFATHSMRRTKATLTFSVSANMATSTLDPVGRRLFRDDDARHRSVCNYGKMLGLSAGPGAADARKSLIIVYRKIGTLP